MTTPTFLSATELAKQLSSGSLTSVELLEHYFDRIDRFNPELGVVVLELREQAMQDAKAADAERARGGKLGAFHGVPMTIKESYGVAGTPATWGNPAWADNVAREDADAVSKLKACGVVLHGKTNVPLGLMDFQSYNGIYGTARNPYDLERTPGGSSGGSAAALAAGLTAFEMGSDIGGSIRNPAHYCGVFGHKPTWDLLSMRGHSGPGDIRSTADLSVIGPLARSADDLRTALEVLAVPDPIRAKGLRFELPTLAGRGLGDLRVATWSEDPVSPVAAEVRERVERVARVIADAGGRVDRETRPGFDSREAYDVYQHLLQATSASRVPKEEYRAILEKLSHRGEDDERPSTRTLRSQTSSFRDWKAADEKRAHLRWQWHEFFDEYDALIVPVMPTAAFEHDHRPWRDRKILIDGAENAYSAQVFWAGLASASYLPSTVIPTGLNDAGLPIGVQIIGPAYADLVCIDIARALEREGFAFVPPPRYA